MDSDAPATTWVSSSPPAVTFTFDLYPPKCYQVIRRS